MSHLGLRKKIENVYTKVKEVGEKSLLLKPVEERKKELLKLRKKKEIEEKLRLEQKKKEEEEARELYWSQMQQNNANNQSVHNIESKMETQMKKSFFTTDFLKN